MRKTLALVCSGLLATSALADDRPTAREPGYQHYMLETFKARPCGEAIAYIDAMDQALVLALLRANTDDMTDEQVMAIILPFMNMTMAFGMILGFEADHPDIRSPAATPLERLRADCAAWPGATAWDLLHRMAQQ